MIGAFKLNTIGRALSDASSSNYFLLYTSSARADDITPLGFQVDSAGNMYILDGYSTKLAKLNSSGVIQWQKYMSSPSGMGSKGDGGILSLSTDGAYLFYQLYDASTSGILFQVNTSDGTVVSDNKMTVASGSSIYLGNTVVTSDGSEVLMALGAKVGTTNRSMLKRYTTSGGLSNVSTASNLPSGSTDVTNVRLAYRSGRTNPYLLSNERFISRYGTTLTRASTYNLAAGNTIHSVALDATTGTYISRNNVIAKWTGDTTLTKSWERTHRISGVNGVSYYGQTMVIDPVDDTIYASYWNATTNKIIIYKLGSDSTLFWTKSIYVGGYTETDSMVLTLGNSSDLYIAFRYGGIASGGTAIMKIPTDGTLTKTFGNGFVLATETGSLTATTTMTLTSNTPATTAITWNNAGTLTVTTSIVSPSIPTSTKESI